MKDLHLTAIETCKMSGLLRIQALLTAELPQSTRTVQVCRGAPMLEDSASEVRKHPALDIGPSQVALRDGVVKRNCSELVEATKTFIHSPWQ